MKRLRTASTVGGISPWIEQAHEIFFNFIACGVLTNDCKEKSHVKSKCKIGSKLFNKLDRQRPTIILPKLLTFI